MTVGEIDHVNNVPIRDVEFNAIRQFLFKAAGIHLSDAKKPLVTGRLAKRLRATGAANYGEYLSVISTNPQERQTVLDLLTTNETYFFREKNHFDYIVNTVLPNRERGRSFRVWSAACSSGEEPYTIAMVLNEQIKNGAYEVIASDISMRMLHRGQQAVYPMERLRQVPQNYLHKYCLKGEGEQAGNIMVCRSLRSKVSFRQINLNEALPNLGSHVDIIFLRNIMIYFQAETKRAIVRRLYEKLSKGGYLFIGHSESLNGISNDFEQVQPAIYKKP